MEIIKLGAYYGTELGSLLCSADWTVYGNIEDLLLGFSFGSADSIELETNECIELVFFYGKVLGATLAYLYIIKLVT